MNGLVSSESSVNQQHILSEGKFYDGPTYLMFLVDLVSFSLTEAKDAQQAPEKCFAFGLPEHILIGNGW